MSKPHEWETHRLYLPGTVCGAGQPKEKPTVNIDVHKWEVRVGYDTATPTPAEKVETLTRALLNQPGVNQAWGSLTGRENTISTAATVIVDASTPGEALDAAIDVFTKATAAIGVSLQRFREAEVHQAGVDPRE